MIDNSSVTYGINPVSELIETRPQDIEAVYIKKRSSGRLFEILKTCRKRKIPCHMVSPERINTIAGSKNNQGITAVSPEKSYETEDHFLERISGTDSPLLILPSSLKDPGNLGAVIRSCAAFGADGLILEPKNRAPLNATVKKCSAGMIERVPVIRPLKTAGLIKRLRETKPFSVIGADLHLEPGRDSVETDFTGPVLLITGGEDKGIPPYLRKECGMYCRIPITEKAESLNISSSVAVLLYEIQRQREFRYQ